MRIASFCSPPSGLRRNTPAWIRVCFFLGVLFLIGPLDPAASATIETRLEAAADRSDGLVSIDRWAEDDEGRGIWGARIGTGDAAEGAVLLVAGLDGRHQIGVELAVRHVESMADEAAKTRALLRGRTIYVVPQMCPIGSHTPSSVPRRMRATAPGQSDSDRDGLTGEDLADDLDGDGILRQVRVHDPDGTLALAPSTSGLLYEALAVEDEVGAWRLLTEGRDDDGDENWNEEEDGGVWLAQNFPHGYEWFARGRGQHQVSERETRVLGDFLAAHPEVGSVLIYGFEDNLLTPLPKGKTSNPSLRGSGYGRTPVTEPNEADLPWLRQLSERYRKVLGVPEKATRIGHSADQVRAENTLLLPDPTEAAKGGLAAYVYYHRGRLALATPAWTPALQGAWNDEAKKAKEAAERSADTSEAPAEKDGDGDAEGESVTTAAESLSDDAPSAAARGIEDPVEKLDESIVSEEAFIAWLLEREDSAWKPWAPIEHPDFPGREAYVGGYAPGARINPPVSEIDSLAVTHQQFLLEVLDLLPRVRLRSVEFTSVGKDVYELSFAVENTGWLPDVLAQGVFSGVVRPTRFELELPAGAEVLGDAARGRLDPIEGRGGAVEETVLLRAPGSGAVTVRIVSEFAGRDERKVRPGQVWRVER